MEHTLDGHSMGEVQWSTTKTSKSWKTSSASSAFESSQNQELNSNNRILNQLEFDNFSGPKQIGFDKTGTANFEQIVTSSRNGFDDLDSGFENTLNSKQVGFDNKGFSQSSFKRVVTSSSSQGGFDDIQNGNQLGFNEFGNNQLGLNKSSQSRFEKVVSSSGQGFDDFNNSNLLSTVQNSKQIGFNGAASSSSSYQKVVRSSQQGFEEDLGSRQYFDDISQPIGAIPEKIVGQSTFERVVKTSKHGFDEIPVSIPIVDSPIYPRKPESDKGTSTYSTIEKVVTTRKASTDGLSQPLKSYPRSSPTPNSFGPGPDSGTSSTHSTFEKVVTTRKQSSAGESILSPTELPVPNTPLYGKPSRTGHSTYEKVVISRKNSSDDTLNPTIYPDSGPVPFPDTFAPGPDKSKTTHSTFEKVVTTRKQSSDDISSPLYKPTFGGPTAHPKPGTDKPTDINKHPSLKPTSAAPAVPKKPGTDKSKTTHSTFEKVVTTRKESSDDSISPTGKPTLGTSGYPKKPVADKAPTNPSARPTFGTPAKPSRPGVDKAAPTPAPNEKAFPRKSSPEDSGKPNQPIYRSTPTPNTLGLDNPNPTASTHSTFEKVIKTRRSSGDTSGPTQPDFRPTPSPSPIDNTASATHSTFEKVVTTRKQSTDDISSPYHKPSFGSPSYQPKPVSEKPVNSGYSTIEKTVTTRKISEDLGAPNQPLYRSAPTPTTLGLDKGTSSTHSTFEKVVTTRKQSIDDLSTPSIQPNYGAPAYPRQPGTDFNNPLLKPAPGYPDTQGTSSTHSTFERVVTRKASEDISNPIQPEYRPIPNPIDNTTNSAHSTFEKVITTRKQSSDDYPVPSLQPTFGPVPIKQGLNKTVSSQSTFEKVVRSSTTGIEETPVSIPIVETPLSPTSSIDDSIRRNSTFEKVVTSTNRGFDDIRDTNRTVDIETLNRTGVNKTVNTSQSRFEKVITSNQQDFDESFNPNYPDFNRSTNINQVGFDQNINSRSLLDNSRTQDIKINVTNDNQSRIHNNRNTHYTTTTTTGKNSKMSCTRTITEARDAAVAEHNRLRRRHGAPDLQQDQRMNDEAQRYAETLSRGNKDTFKPSYTHKYGENIATSVKRDKVEAIQDAITRMYDTVQFYDYNRPGFNVGNKPTGLFSSIVWKSTVKIGVGIAWNQVEENYSIVFYYDPMTNITSRFQENVFPPCS